MRIQIGCNAEQELVIKADQKPTVHSLWSAINTNNVVNFQYNVPTRRQHIPFVYLGRPTMQLEIGNSVSLTRHTHNPILSWQLFIAMP